MLSVEDREVSPPGTDVFGVPLCQDAGDLGNVVEVVNGPSCQELPKTDRPELRVAPSQCQLSLGQTPASDGLEIAEPKLGEPVEEVID